jgi:hypothetical protein
VDPTKDHCSANVKEADEMEQRMAAWCAATDMPNCKGRTPIQAQAFTEEQWQCTLGFSEKCLGPLAKLIGRWEGTFGKTYSALPQYEPLSENEATKIEHFAGTPPGQPTAFFHALKNQTYKETLTFTPIPGPVLNRGYENADGLNPKCQSNQYLTGVQYTQQVFLTNPTDLDGSTDELVHAETGMWMYNAVPASGGGTADDFTVSRMSVIPHGVSMVADGQWTTVTGPSDANVGVKDQLLAAINAIDMTTGADGGGAVFPSGCFPDDSYDTENKRWGSATKVATAATAEGKDGTGCGVEPQGNEGSVDQLTSMNAFLTNETMKLSG